jgi:hypothetical protein
VPTATRTPATKTEPAPSRGSARGDGRPAGTVPEVGPTPDTTWYSYRLGQDRLADVAALVASTMCAASATRGPRRPGSAARAGADSSTWIGTSGHRVTSLLTTWIKVSRALGSRSISAGVKPNPRRCCSPRAWTCASTGTSAPSTTTPTPTSTRHLPARAGDAGLVDHDQHPAVPAQGLEHRPQRGLVVGQRPVVQPPARSVHRRGVRTCQRPVRKTLRTARSRSRSTAAPSSSRQADLDTRAGRHVTSRPRTRVRSLSAVVGALRPR